MRPLEEEVSLWPSLQLKNVKGIHCLHNIQNHFFLNSHSWYQSSSSEIDLLSDYPQFLQLSHIYRFGNPIFLHPFNIDFRQSLHPAPLIPPHIQQTSEAILLHRPNPRLFLFSLYHCHTAIQHNKPEQYLIPSHIQAEDL